ncbi:MAG: hypothetical protein ACO3YU_05270 [Candidatus Nanopelagicales bacterium]|jgi:hypothetical protein
MTSSIHTAVVVASEAGGEAGAPAWLFGVVAFAILSALLVVTMMIKVDR